MRRALRLVVLGGLAAHGAADAPQPAAPTGALAVSVLAHQIGAPDTVTAGWSRLHVNEDGEGHIVVVFRLPARTTDADLAAYLTVLDTAAGTPSPLVALGGPEVGDTGTVIMELTPGRYVLGCVTRGADGHRHLARGESRTLVVTARDRAARSRGRPGSPPPATQDVRMTDFAYLTSDRWPAGPHVLRVRNTGTQDHQLRLARLRPGSTIEGWMHADRPGRHVIDVAGVARLGAGRVAYLPVELPGGDYVAYCLVKDPRTGRTHMELGMFRAIRVE